MYVHICRHMLITCICTYVYKFASIRTRAYEFDGTAKESEQPHLTAAPMLIDVCLWFCLLLLRVYECSLYHDTRKQRIRYIVMLWHIEKWNEYIKMFTRCSYIHMRFVSRVKSFFSLSVIAVRMFATIQFMSWVRVQLQISMSGKADTTNSDYIWRAHKKSMKWILYGCAWYTFRTIFFSSI